MIRNGSCRAQRVFALAILSPLSASHASVYIAEKHTSLSVKRHEMCAALDFCTINNTDYDDGQSPSAQWSAPSATHSHRMRCSADHSPDETSTREFLPLFRFYFSAFFTRFLFFCLTHFILSLSPSTLDFQAHTNLSCNYRWKHRKSSEIYTPFLPLLRPMINSF